MFITVDKNGYVNSWSWAKNSPDMIEIDVLDMNGIKKGEFSEIMSNVIGFQALSPEMIKYYGFNNVDDIKIIRNNGDAMAPTINSDDLLWLDISYKKPTADGIYLISTNQNVLLRRIQINPFDNSLDLSADNKSYKSFTITANEPLNICGKVIMITHKM